RTRTARGSRSVLGRVPGVGRYRPVGGDRSASGTRGRGLGARRAREASPDEGTLTADPTALALGHPAPDPELLAVPQRVLEALVLDLAATTDRLGLLGGRPAFGEEQVGIDSEAVGTFLPTAIGRVDFELDEHLPHRRASQVCAAR